MMLNTHTPVEIFCNGAAPSESSGKYIILDHDEDNPNKNVKIKLPDFVRNINYLPSRLKDLLEVASYVFIADRKVSRGNRDAVEYHAWSRNLKFVIKIRDVEFWSRTDVKKSLSQALQFITGDRNYEFTFLGGHKDKPVGLFDNKNFVMNSDGFESIVLFSGGLDSMAGVLEKLNTTNERLLLISHTSGQPGTKKTQDALFEVLERDFSSRCCHIRFYCSLTGNNGVEETQRTRTFLYSSIAFSIASTANKEAIYYYENGITSLNFPRRSDLMNGRASRTTHPKSLKMLQNFFSLFGEKKVEIKHPFLFKTKTDIFSIFRKYHKESYISSTISCGNSYHHEGPAKQCGGCFQCIDRRLAAYSSGLHEYDDYGLYGFDFINDQFIPGKEQIKTTIIDYIHQAKQYLELNLDSFSYQMMSELTDIDDYIEGTDEEDKIERIFNLCQSHGHNIENALLQIQNGLSPFKIVPDNSFMGIVSRREYLKEPVERLVELICKKLNRAIPIIYRKNKPKDENDFNDKLSGLLSGDDRVDLEREHPLISFALAKTIPDHSTKNLDLLIESKYIRGKTTPSKVTEGIAADITKYSKFKPFLLFVVYDPERKIHDDEKFAKDFEQNRRCKINIVR